MPAQRNTRRDSRSTRRLPRSRCPVPGAAQREPHPAQTQPRPAHRLALHEDPAWNPQDLKTPNLATRTKVAGEWGSKLTDISVSLRPRECQGSIEAIVKNQPIH